MRKRLLKKIATAVGGQIERRLDKMGFPLGRGTMPVELQEKWTEAKALGIGDSARLLGISPHTVRLHISQGKIHAIRFGRRVLVPMESLQMVLKWKWPVGIARLDPGHLRALSRARRLCSEPGYRLMN